MPIGSSLFGGAILAPMDDAERAREYLRERLSSYELAPLSRRLEHAHTYLHQYLNRGRPLWLSEPDRTALVTMVPDIDPEKIAPPPKVVRLSSPHERGRQRQDEPEVQPPRFGQIDDDPRTLDLLNAWSNIRDPKMRDLALNVVLQFAPSRVPKAG